MSEYHDDGFVTELPCRVCGTAVFQRTARAKNFCSKRCERLHWHRLHPGSRGQDSMKSCTITVAYSDERFRTFVGFGDLPSDAHEHALEQAAKLGPFTEIGFVTPNKIRRDLARYAE